MASSPGLSRRIVSNDDNITKEVDEQISTSSSSSDNFNKDSHMLTKNSDSSSSDDDNNEPLESLQKSTSLTNIRGRDGIHQYTGKMSSSSPTDSVKYKKQEDVTDFSKSTETIYHKAAEKKHSTPPKKINNVIKSEEKRPSYIAGFVFLLFSICAFPYVMQINESSNESNKLDIPQSIKTISTDYPIQNEDVWNHLLSGIQRLINQEKEPSIFFLVQWSDENNTAFNIATAAGEVTARNLSYPNDVGYPLILHPDVLNHLDRGDLIDLYQKDLELGHVLIVKDIEKVSPHVAQDFRYYCDEDNPLVGKSIIFFIMNMERCADVTLNSVYGGPLRNTIGAVEKCLTEFWGTRDGLDSTILYPVLSRIVNIVLPIQDAPKTN